MQPIKLTAKQEAFAQAIASGMTQADAYRTAYRAEKMASATIWSKASELMADGKVAERVANLRADLEAKQLWTREMSVKGLIDAYEVAKREKIASGMTGAIKELNAMHGYNEPARLNVNAMIFPTSIDDLI